MKTRNWQNMLAVIAVTGLALSASTALAQDSAGTSTVPPAASNVPVPQLSYDAAQIVKLAQAKVSDDTIIIYIRNSSNSYGLDAGQIIYLRQQGVSEAVITTMLKQPRPGVAAATPTTPAPPPVVATDYTAQVQTATAPPPVTYVQTVPDPPYYYQPYYYPAYAWYPPVTFSFGWGGWYGGGWRGGWGGGWHGGGHGGGHR